VTARLDAGRETAPARLPWQRSIGLVDLIDEGTALLGARLDARRSTRPEDSRSER
jgi:hypothetical protein